MHKQPGVLLLLGDNRSLHSHRPPLHRVPGGTGGEREYLTSHSQKATFKEWESDQEIAFDTVFCALTEQKKAAPPDRKDATTTAEPEGQQAEQWLMHAHGNVPSRNQLLSLTTNQASDLSNVFHIPSRDGVKTH